MVRVVLSRPIEALAWTIVSHSESRAVVQLGFLPGDVDASRITTPLDLLSLVDDLNHGPGALPEWSSDIDRSEVVDADDVFALIALFDGTIDGQTYLGASLP
jgi:hypothetical protein